MDIPFTANMSSTGGNVAPRDSKQEANEMEPINQLLKDNKDDILGVVWLYGHRHRIAALIAIMFAVVSTIVSVVWSIRNEDHVSRFILRRLFTRKTLIEFLEPNGVTGTINVELVTWGPGVVLTPPDLASLPGSNWEQRSEISFPGSQPFDNLIVTGVAYHNDRIKGYKLEKIPGGDKHNDRWQMIMTFDKDKFIDKGWPNVLPIFQLAKLHVTGAVTFGPDKSLTP